MTNNEFKDILLNITSSLSKDKYKEYINKDNIDNYIKILEEEINKYLNLSTGIEKRDLHLTSKDLTDNAPANARRRYKKALERINNHNRNLRRPLLKYDEHDKKNMAKTLRLYFIIVNIEVLNRKTKLAILRKRVEVLKEIKNNL